MTIIIIIGVFAAIVIMLHLLKRSIAEADEELDRPWPTVIDPLPERHKKNVSIPDQLPKNYLRWVKKGNLASKPRPMSPEDFGILRANHKTL